MRIALELSEHNRVYEVLATKFFEHFVYIGAAMKKMGGRNYQLWDENDGFFYDVLRYPNGDFVTGSPIAPHERRRYLNIPPQLSTLVLKALAKEPSERYRDGNELLEHLQVIANEIRDS